MALSPITNPPHPSRVHLCGSQVTPGLNYYEWGAIQIFGGGKGKRSGEFVGRKRRLFVEGDIQSRKVPVVGQKVGIF